MSVKPADLVHVLSLPGVVDGPVLLSRMATLMTPFADCPVRCARVSSFPTTLQVGASFVVLFLLFVSLIVAEERIAHEVVRSGIVSFSATLLAHGRGFLFFPRRYFIIVVWELPLHREKDLSQSELMVAPLSLSLC